MRLICLAAWFAAGLTLAQQPSVEETIQLVRTKSPQLKDALLKQMPGLRNANASANTVWGQDFLFAANVPGGKAPMLVLNDGVPVPMMRADESSDIWYRLEKMRTGVTYGFQIVADGKALAPRGDVVGYNPDSYPKPGVPQGKLSEKFVLTSKLYEGMKADYWVYASPGVDPAKPAALMVWQDGQGLINRSQGMRLFTVTENLIAQKLMPPVVYVLIAPGFTPEGRPLRAIEYDTVSPKYTTFLMREVLPEVEKMYKLRPDGYSRAIGGSSSGAICSFTAGWFHPEFFSRIHSGVGSFTSIQWRPEEKLDGGNLYPFKVRKEPKRNIRVWMSDGSDDLENNHGSWPLQNIQLANSLKMREYDFHFRFGTSAHNGSQASLDLPESLAWLWRGYDPEKTEEIYRMDPAEKEKPYYRVKISNREAW